MTAPTLMQLSLAEHQTIRDLEAELAVVRLGATASVFDDVLPAARTLLDVENVVLSNQAEQPDGRLAVTRYHVAGMRGAEAELIQRFNRFFASGPVRRYGAYDPACPEPEQRNRFLDAFELMGEAFADSRVCREVLAPVGLGRHHQPRVLLCEGASLLAWFGSFHPRAFTRRQRTLLCRLVPSVRRRLLVERQLGDRPSYLATIEACLEHLGMPALVVNARGRVLESNAAGRALLAKRRAELRGSLAERLRGRAAELPFELTPLDTGSAARTWLATLPARASDARVRNQVTTAVRRWSLTTRQADVLAHLVQGASTAAIAASLGISVRAVELHLTAMFDRAGVESRAALVAAALLGQ